MKKADKLFLFGLIAGSIALFQSKPAFAHSANGATSFTVSENPVQLVSGNDVTVYTTTFSMDSGFSSAHPEQVDNGKVVIQMATDGLGAPAPSGSAVSWVAVNSPGVQPVGGKTEASLDLNAWGFIPGTVAGLRALYVSGDGDDSVKTHSSLAVDLVAATEPCENSGVAVAAELTSGNGNPPPGFSTENGDTFVFTIKTRNCSGKNLSAVKVQGGTNGWTTLLAATPLKGEVSVRENKRNQVITWTVDLAQGEAQTLVVILNGSIPEYADCSPDPNAPEPDSIRFLSGEWSAVYMSETGPQKTEYTGRVSVTVTCP